MPSQSFDYTGTWQTFRVPAGVELLTVGVNGAGSGPRHGGRVAGRLRVRGGQILYILVGQEGRPNVGRVGGSATYGGGGAGGNGLDGPGGYSGGGGSHIRSGSRTGPVMAAAGGAGGASGDGGRGGAGGAATGMSGFPGTAGPGAVGNATGGTQSQAGNGGTSSALASLNGRGGNEVINGLGGSGGTGLVVGTFGGGGGGGGYYPGGGGQAGLTGRTPGGGGAGGSNWVGSLTGFTTEQGGGALNHGLVSITWTSPAPANQPPSVPSDVRINNLPIADGLTTNAVGFVNVSAVVDDPTINGQRVRMEVRYSAKRDFSSGVGLETSLYRAQETRVSVNLQGLTPNTQYYLRIHARDAAGLPSLNYRSTSFWTNRFPLEPVLQTPPDNAETTTLISTVFTWQHVDPDSGANPAVQNAFRIRWRRAATPFAPAGAWVQHGQVTAGEQYVADPGAFKSNTFYEWQVQTRDNQGMWGPWASPSTFFVSGTSTPPMVREPTGAEAVVITDPVALSWKFRDPDQGDAQTKADIRYRPAGTPTWFTVLGNVSTPGSAQIWEFAADTFPASTLTEWQVRTYDSSTPEASDWSDSAFFWGIRTPGVSVAEPVFPEFTTVQESLGCGNNRVFIYDRGGRYLRGEITPLASIRWGRKRDDISSCLISTNGFDSDCGDLLSRTRTWAHELVVFRDGVRVWEGPISRIQGQQGNVEIEAKDVFNYLYRRIMRQGYNDSYRMVNGQRVGRKSVVERASRITMNALAPDDPNVLPYLTTLEFPDDAGQSRIVPDYSRTAWEEIDDLAATAGLDYTAVGRRMIFWDTHRPLGRLPEMRDENFSDPPIVTEYGMQLATGYAVTNNNGIYGAANRDFGPYGLVEILVSAYGETEGGATEVLTAAAREELEATLRLQAVRGIAARYPAPLHVRVPDNSALHPDTNVDINRLIPGVWVPVRATGTIRDVAQWQKLDVMEVTQDKGGEKITVTMSPAPNAGADPDAENQEED